MTRYHLVKIHFDRRSPKATDEWLARRFKFFEGWTLQSLLGQTFRDFRIWFHCDPGMEEAVRPLRAVAPEGSLFTFLPYGHTPLGQDDTASMLSGDDRFRTADYVYVTRIDSDDLYACDALELVDQLRPRASGIEAGLFRQGHIHDVRTGLARTFRNASSPFHTLMVPREVFCDARRYANGFVGDHSKVEQSYISQGLPDWKFTVLVHGDNFLSDMDYSTEKQEPLEAYWSNFASPCHVWQRQPVVFDLDDFCDRHNCLPELDRLKEMYPDFRATLFTIPAETSPGLLAEARKRDWLELAVHGITHEPNEELKALAPTDLRMYLACGNWKGYAKGFRPPGWFITEGHVKAISDAGFWVALHARDRDALSPHCTHGFYCCEDGPRRRLPYWHGHTHQTCQNGIQERLAELLVKWPRGQQFLFVSDAVLRPQGG